MPTHLHTRLNNIIVANRDAVIVDTSTWLPMCTSPSLANAPHKNCPLCGGGAASPWLLPARTTQHDGGCNQFAVLCSAAETRRRLEARQRRDPCIVASFSDPKSILHSPLPDPHADVAVVTASDRRRPPAVQRRNLQNEISYQTLAYLHIPPMVPPSVNWQQPASGSKSLRCISEQRRAAVGRAKRVGPPV